ncbi:enoyl-CoA hydratase/isomerase family protein [Halioxenophilus sp. WMMB6]|uniref:enoyl-CoA hydratase/isomerase family protein n=1 Tax=Halioxenophilus sp. WMMB6 TaxID=3073815 RepID=UPI00295E5440|nr:enoyl-CoA hydratase/isomerase family protein [Halioxenophilus sp. WMMB6]
MASINTSKVATERLGPVTLVELQNPPHNFFDIDILTELADTILALDDDPDCRAIVLASQGKNFCAGGNFGTGAAGSGYDTFNRDNFASEIGKVYGQGARIFANKKPIVAAVQGSATGGGLGLSLTADFRVASPQSKFWANFTKLGIHTGFGATVTLPRVIGLQAAHKWLMTGRRIGGIEAEKIGLVDHLTTNELIRADAIVLAQDIAGNAPLAVASIRAAVREGLQAAVMAAIEVEVREQSRLRVTEDAEEGIRSIAQKRPGRFLGR